MITTKGTSRNPKTRGVISLVNQLHGGANLGGSIPPAYVSKTVAEYIRGGSGFNQTRVPSIVPSRPIFQSGTVLGGNVASAANSNIQQSGGASTDQSSNEEAIARAVRAAIQDLNIQVSVVEIIESAANIVELTEQGNAI